jgi:hypothetical protein
MYTKKSRHAVEAVGWLEVFLKATILDGARQNTFFMFQNTTIQFS